jgi:hypothetical protein
MAATADWISARMRDSVTERGIHKQIRASQQGGAKSYAIFTQALFILPKIGNSFWQFVR